MNEKCDICGKRELLPFRCKYCGGTFCSEHRLPENHECPGINTEEYWNVPVRVRKSSKRTVIPSTTKSSVKVAKPKIPNYGANNTVIIVCAILFFISIVARRTMVDLFALHPDLEVLVLRPWQLITSMFLHIEFWHFFINMFVLLFFGSELERRLGDKMYLKIFFLSGLAGNLGYIVYAYTVDTFIPALGASAAIFGIMGCLAIIAPEIRVMIFPFPIPIGIRTALFLFAAYDFWMMTLTTAGVMTTNVANIAHLAGLAFGLYYGKKIGRVPYYPYRFVDRF